MKEFDLFVPLTYNDGTPIDARVFQQLQARLVAEFGGLTFFPQPNEGYWTTAGVTYRDQIVIYRVIVSNARAARRYFAKLKEELKTTLNQEEILIVIRDVETM